tara:strand:- start:18 stop:815 length:798 start_codon:yes stop_codon:yes gene_type:complete
MPRHRKSKRYSRKLKRVKGGAMPNDARTILFKNMTQIPMIIQISPIGDLNRYYNFTRPLARTEVLEPGAFSLNNDLDIDYTISITPNVDLPQQAVLWGGPIIPFRIETNDKRLARFNVANIRITGIDLMGNSFSGKYPEIDLEIKNNIRPYKLADGERFACEAPHRLRGSDEDADVGAFWRDNDPFSPNFTKPIRLIPRPRPKILPTPQEEISILAAKIAASRAANDARKAALRAKNAARFSQTKKSSKPSKTKGKTKGGTRSKK